MTVVSIHDDKIEFVWETIDISSTTISFKLNFESPLEVSQLIDAPDRLEIRIHDALMFATRFDTAVETSEMFFEIDLPKQMLFADTQLTTITVIATEVIATSLMIVIATSFILSFFWQASLQLLIGDLWVVLCAVLVVFGIGTDIPASVHG